MKNSGKKYVYVTDALPLVIFLMISDITLKKVTFPLGKIFPQYTLEGDEEYIKQRLKDAPETCFFICLCLEAASVLGECKDLAQNKKDGMFGFHGNGFDFDKWVRRYLDSEPTNIEDEGAGMEAVPRESISELGS